MMTRDQRQMRNAFYETPAWRKLRREILHRDKFRCAECGRVGGRGLSVHHISPAFDDNGVKENALDANNLQVLCRPCHTARHEAQKRQALSPAERRWQDLLERLYPLPTYH